MMIAGGNSQKSDREKKEKKEKKSLQKKEKKSLTFEPFFPSKVRLPLPNI